MPPDLVPPPRPGRNDRLREARPAERVRAMRHAYPVSASGGRVIPASLQYPLTQIVGRSDLRHRAGRGRNRRRNRNQSRNRSQSRNRRRAAARALRRSEPAQAFVPRDRVQPGAELVRVTEPLQPGGGDDKRIGHRVGRLARRVRVGQHEPTVGEKRRCVTIERLGEAVGVASDDGRDQLTVLHGPNRSSPPHDGESERYNQIAEKRTKDSYGLSCTRRPGEVGAGSPRRWCRAGPEGGTGSRPARWFPSRAQT